jgi:hypothetical protein
MSHFDALVSWLKANWPWVAAALVYILTNLANGLLKYPRVRTIIGFIVDLLSSTTRSDSPGTLKLPFTLSKPPGGSTAATVADPRITALLPLLGLLGASGALLAGCAHSFETAQLAEGAASKSLGATATAWVEYSAKHQLELVDAAPDKAAAQAALKEWRTKVQAPVTKSLRGAWGALDALDAALVAYKRDKSGDLVGAVAVVWHAAGELTGVLQSLGVPVPVPSTGGGAK